MKKHLVRILGAWVCWVEGFGVLGFRPRTQLKGVRHKVRDLRDSAPGLGVWKLWDVRSVEMSRSPASCAHESMTLSRGFVKQYRGWFTWGSGSLKIKDAILEDAYV